MTTVYFIRHAQSDNSARRGGRDDATRPLTAQGFASRALVADFLRDKKIDAVFSSPYKRAVDTVSLFAENASLPIQAIDDLRERKVDSVWVEDFIAFAEKQWADFSYKLSDGESLSEVQARNIAALSDIIENNRGKNIVIGTHGTALSTIINYYDKTYGFEDFMAMVGKMPWAVMMVFDKNGCAQIIKIDLPPKDRSAETWEVVTADLGSLKSYRYVVVFARHKGAWLYCRAKGRDTYEAPGGHIEPGESALEAAGRELCEETGATDFDITPAFDYSTRRQNSWSKAQVFFADVRELGALPGFEMEETKRFDGIPDKMTYPQVLPPLFERMQAWVADKGFVA